MEQRMREKAVELLNEKFIYKSADEKVQPRFTTPRELALVYDNIICGKDCFKEKPLRSHLRHSIKEERAEKERKEKAKQNKRYGAPTGPSKS